MNKAKMMNQAMVAYTDERRLLDGQQDERKRKVCKELTERLAKLFGCSIPPLKENRFKLGNIELALDDYGDKLYMVKDCPLCKKEIKTRMIYSLSHIGQALAGNFPWGQHYCVEKERAERKTPAEQVLDLLCQLQEIIGPLLPE